MKKIKNFLTLSSAGLLLSTFNPSNLSIFAQDDSDTEEISQSMETESESSETTESSDSTDKTESTDSSEATDIKEYDFEVETEVINADKAEIGTATFRQDTDGIVTVELKLKDLEAGEYGMHIHTVGLATAPTFEDAGGHFNPKDVEHGTESETGPHAGDLPNLVVGEDGIVEETIEIPDVSLDPAGENTLNSTDGTTLIIHEGTDDYTTQPTGDAGDRQAAAVIFAPLEDSEFFQADAESSDASDEADETDEASESDDASETTDASSESSSDASDDD